MSKWGLEGNFNSKSLCTKTHLTDGICSLTFSQPVILFRLLRKASLNDSDESVFNFYLDKIATETDQDRKEAMKFAADETDPECSGLTPLMAVSHIVLL